eukprot:CAMPEP_0196161558 /NCGR_PEP_ID=MMETSP0910-20130528/47393_1 /TAXON_ID=49265 /ORGANISM="Thalassiosira rotula, Strain GSO102" /LENGTH=572 /DNA_ID=CAMNT_0041426503 /DNA_START=39 /DNA_END=1757 /DNA_ORIENTATION=+
MASSTSSKEQQLLLKKLQNFTTRHTSHHIPLALVTSGGTAAPLEHNCVRFLDNFSTGTRGAYAVEEFCKRGYAVIHLKRAGSIAPFGRILGEVLGCGKGGPDFDSLGVLFDCGGGLGSEEEEEENYDATNNFGLQDIEEDDEQEGKEASGGYAPVDPWMYSNSNQPQHDKSNRTPKSISRSKQRGDLSLNHRLVHSPQLQSTLRTYKRIKNAGLLLTIDFRTVDDYLHKLQLCSEALNTCGSLGLVYLAAAVSDFYIPDEKKVLHKIQSRDYGIKSQASSSTESSNGGDGGGETTSPMQVQSDNTLTLTLYPVPKVIPSLRKDWCPNAFVISFKLETDPSILRQKAVMAMERNDVHMVVGNELATRYEKVFILSRNSNGDLIDSLNADEPLSSSSEAKRAASSDLPEGFHMAEVNASHGLSMSPSLGSGKKVDALEYATIEYVARRHFTDSPCPLLWGVAKKVDALEYATIEYVARRHFHYISTNIHHGGDGANDPPVTVRMSSAAETTARQTLEATSLHEERLVSAQRRLQRERLKAKVAELAWNAAGSALGIALSYGISKMLQGRQQGMA